MKLQINAENPLFLLGICIYFNLQPSLSCCVPFQVLELSDWTPQEGLSATIKQAAPPSGAEGLTPFPPRQTPQEEYLQHPQQQHQQQQQQGQHTQQQQGQQLRREARLTYVISCPIGSSDAVSAQEQTLRVQDGGAIFFSHSDCITGFPLIPGDLNITATYTITPIEGRETPGESVLVRVGVTVGHINFPPPFGAIEPMVAGIVEKDVKKQATKWLQEMTEADLREIVN